MYSQEYYENRSAWIEYLKGASPQEVNENHHGQTHFEMVYDYEIYEYLYGAGYTSQDSDIEFLKRKWAEIGTADQKEVWFSARVANKLNEPMKIKKACAKMRVLCVIFSLKQNEIIGYRFYNFLALMNNALEHHKSSNRILLKAMHHYKRYELVRQMDQKNTFQAKEQRFRKEQPLQDVELESLIYELFPELMP